MLTTLKSLWKKIFLPVISLLDTIHIGQKIFFLRHHNSKRYLDGPIKMNYPVCIYNTIYN